MPLHVACHFEGFGEPGASQAWSAKTENVTSASVLGFKMSGWNEMVSFFAFIISTSLFYPTLVLVVSILIWSLLAARPFIINHLVEFEFSFSKA